MEMEMGKEMMKEMDGEAELGIQVMKEVEVLSLLVRSLSPVL